VGVSITKADRLRKQHEVIVYGEYQLISDDHLQIYKYTRILVDGILLVINNFSAEAAEASVFTDVLGWNKWEGDGSTEVTTVGLNRLVNI
jgi:glycosidase